MIDKRKTLSENIASTEEYWAKASPTPWVAELNGVMSYGGDDSFEVIKISEGTVDDTCAIAQAPYQVSYLIDIIKGMRPVLQRLTDAAKEGSIKLRSLTYRDDYSNFMSLRVELDDAITEARKLLEEK